MFHRIPRTLFSFRVRLGAVKGFKISRDVFAILAETKLQGIAYKINNAGLHHAFREDGVEVSSDLISRVTDAVLEDVKAWQTRALLRSNRSSFSARIV